jgi:uncharacterized surface protein with fasciclin (FAS1) repeats
MRSRHLAVASATVALSVFAVACGSDKDEAQAPGSNGGTSSSQTSTPSTPDPIAPDKTTPKDTRPGKSTKDGTLAEAASSNDDLTNFSTAIGAANLTATLGQPGPYTIFAPNNDGFAKLGTKLDTLLQPASQAELANILKFHVVSGRLNSKELKDGKLLTTLQGTRLRVTKKNGQLSIGNSEGTANIVSSDLDSSNGVIHVIDTVLTPKK